MPTIDETDVPFLDIFDPEVAADLQGRTGALLADGHWLVRTPVWYSVIDHDGVRALQKEPGLGTLGPALFETAGDHRGRPPRAVGADPAVTRRRAPHALARPGVAGVHPPLHRGAASGHARLPRPARLDALDLDRPIEFMAEVAEEYPIAMICALVGAPAEDWPRFSVWATSILKQFSFHVADDLDEIETAITEMSAYIEALVARRQTDPGDDLISALLAVEAEGDRVSHVEVVDLVTALLVAGTDTTRNELGLALWRFAAHPDQWQLLIDHPSLVPAAVEEVLRFEPTVGATPRIVVEEFTFRDVTFPVGTAVGLISGAANRDPGQLAKPDHFDITAERGPFQHLTFGSGPHYCLGANLARAELQEALRLLAERWATVELAGEPAMRDFTGIYGPITLPLRVTPRA